MMKNQNVSKKSESKTPAGLAGAGGGTLVAVIASSLDESNPFKQWLLYAAPSISILLSAIWIWIQVTIGNYFRDIEVKNLINNAKSTLEEALKNTNTSEQHKELLRKKLEQLELVNVDRLLYRVDSLKVITASDISTHNKSFHRTAAPSASSRGSGR